MAVMGWPVEPAVEAAAAPAVGVGEAVVGRRRCARAEAEAEAEAQVRPEALLLVQPWPHHAPGATLDAAGPGAATHAMRPGKAVAPGEGSAQRTSLQQHPGPRDLLAHHSIIEQTVQVGPILAAPEGPAAADCHPVPGPARHWAGPSLLTQGLGRHVACWVATGCEAAAHPAVGAAG